MVTCCNWEDDECKELTLPNVSKTSPALFLDVTQSIRAGGEDVFNKVTREGGMCVWFPATL